MKKHWPASSSYSKKVPEHGERGAFKTTPFYKRQEIWHTGVDLYCPAGSKVVAVEDCEIINIEQFTGAPESPRWRKTWSITVKNNSGSVVVYGEIKKPKFKTGKKIKAGQKIGEIAIVEWAKSTSDKRKRSMLHFELYKKGTKKTVDWWHKGTKRPSNLLNPTNYLKSIEG